MTHDELEAGTLVFPEYEAALIGVTTVGRAVYAYDLMVEVMVREDGITAEEAEEWLQYNTICTAAYLGCRGPVIVYRADTEADG